MLQAPVLTRPSTQPSVTSPIREHTPCLSHAPSTAPLPTAPRQIYKYNNQTYKTAKEVIRALGENYRINQDLVKWMTESIKAISNEGVVSMHNYVASKINKAVDGLNHSISKVQHDVENKTAAQEAAIAELHHRNWELTQKISNLEVNNDRLYQNSLVQQQSLKTLEDAFRALVSTHAQLVMGQATINPVPQSALLGTTTSSSSGPAQMPIYTQVPPPVPPTAQHTFLQPQMQGPRLKMPDPPKFSGTGKVKLCDWLLNIKLFCTYSTGQLHTPVHCSFLPRRGCSKLHENMV
jgi:hypothetical protein